MRKVSAALMLYNLTVTAALASYDSGGMSVNGNFSDNSYGGQKYPYRLHEYIDTVPKMVHQPRLAIRPKAHEVKLAALEEPKNLTPQQPIISDKPSSILVPEKPTISEENDQRLLAERSIEKVAVNRAYRVREKEGDHDWTCLTPDTKLMLAKIEARFGKGSFDGTCVHRNVRGTGMPSQHSYGRAIDYFPSKGHTNKEVVTWLIEHKKEGWFSGLMTYRNFDHIHIDTGPYHFVSLHAWG